MKVALSSSSFSHIVWEQNSLADQLSKRGVKVFPEYIHYDFQVQNSVINSGYFIFACCILRGCALADRLFLFILIMVPSLDLPLYFWKELLCLSYSVCRSLGRILRPLLVDMS